MEMSSIKKLIRGIGKVDLARCVEEFADDLGSKPFTTLMVVPTPALRDRIKGMLIGRDLPMIDRTVCTLDDLTDHILGSMEEDTWIIDDCQMEMVIHRVIVENRDRLSLLLAGGEGTSMVPQLRAFMELLIDFKVDYPRCLGDLQGRRSEELSLIFEGCLDLMGSHGCLNGGMAKLRAIEELEAGGKRYDRVVILGFYEPKPIEMELMLALANASRFSDLMIPYIPDDSIFGDDGSWFLADEVVDLQGEERVHRISSILAGKEGSIDGVRMSRFKDRIEEARSIAQRVSDLVKSGVDEGRMAIMLPMRSRSAPLIRRALDDCGIASDVLVETSLDQSPLVQTLTDVLEATSSDYSREPVVRLLRSPFVRFEAASGRELYGGSVDHFSLEAGVLEGRDGWSSSLDALALDLEEELDSPELPEPSRERLRTKIGRIRDVREDLDELFDLLGGLKTCAPIGQMVSGYRSVLDRLQVDRCLRRKGVTRGEGEAMRKFSELLDGLEAGPIRKELVDLEGLIGMMDLLVSSSSYKEDERNENAVQVVGLRGTILQDFDHVFVAGMVDGEIPFLSAELALSTEEEKWRMGILSRHDMLRHELYYFVHALTLAREMTYLSAPLSDGDSKLVPSSFFDRLDSENMDGFAPKLLTASTICSQRLVGELLSGKVNDIPEALAPLDIDLDATVERIDVERCHRKGEYDTCFDAVLQDDGIREEMRTFHKDRTYSPTVLETYAECPFWYYMRYVLRIEPPPELEMEISARDRGTLFHRIAHRFYSSRKEEGKGKVSQEEAVVEWGRMMDIAREELARYSFSGPAWNAFRAGMLGTPERKGLLTAFLDHELENPISELDPAHFELSMGVPLSDGSDPGSTEEPVSIPLVDEDIRMRCKIDRVDTDPKGRFFVIDYKTGNVPSLADIRAGRRLQLPLYLLAYGAANPQSTPIGGTYYQVKSTKDLRYGSTIGDSFHATAMGKAARSKGVNPDFRKLIEGTKWRVQGHLEDMTEGIFHPRICNGKCPPYCEYKGICRFNDLRLFEMEGDDEAH